MFAKQIEIGIRLKVRMKINFHSLLHLILGFLLFDSISLHAQQFQFSNLGLNDGLAQSQVYCIQEDEKGYLWMGTNGGGLSRFNGIEFETFTEDQGLSSNYILSLLVDENQRLWAGTANGLNLFEGHGFRKIKSNFKKLKITALASLGNDSVLIGTNQGLFQIKDSILIPINIKGLNTKGDISSIKFHPDGSVWIASDAGLSRIYKSEIQNFTKSNGLSGNLVRSICFDTLGGTWVGTYGNGINYIKDGVIQGPVGFKLNTNLIANDLYLYSPSQLWIATVNQGLCIYNPQDSSYSPLTERSGLANDFVNSIFKDSWGNYWLGTSGGGVSKYSGQQFEHYDRNNGLKGNYIYSIQGSGDSLWLSSSAGGISLFRNNSAVRYGLDSGFTDAKVKAIFQSKDGLLWIGTEGSGMAMFDGDTFVFYKTEDGIGSNWIKDIIEDGKGRIWIATSGGGISCLTEFDSLGSPVFRKYRQSDGLPSNRFIDLHLDTLGRLWFASRYGGIGFFENDSSIRNFGLGDGLLSETVRSLDENEKGELWIGTNTGVCILHLYENNFKIRKFEGNANLSSSNVYVLKYDKAQNLWLGSEKGVDKFKLDLEGNVIESYHFGSDEGFIGVETNINSVYADPSGDMWFGTINGLHRYLSEVRISNQKAPILNFTSVNLDYTPIEKTPFFKANSLKTIKLPYNENNLTFEFLGITQTLPKKVGYKWILDGQDKKWSPISKRRSVNYSNLEPGDYSFQVKSVNENGVWNGQALKFRFIIEKPIWEESWFILSYLAAGILFIVLIFTSRFRSIKRKSKAKQEKISMEKDLVVLEQKALRLQMNPHFIFHTLNSIQALIATKEEGIARDYLSKFSRLMRQILENSRQNEITLDSEIETLENYLSIEQFVNEGGFEFQFDSPQDIEKEFIKIPPMIIQPFVENAIIHGISHLEKGKGKIKISFRDLEHILECTIEDNGVGRKKSSEIKETSNKLHQSTALAVTQERLQFLSSEKTSIQIIDLEDESNNSLGTKVVLRLPIFDAQDS